MAVGSSGITGVLQHRRLREGTDLARNTVLHLATDSDPELLAPPSSGNSTENMAPATGALLAVIVPPNASTIFFTSQRPRPKPP